TCAENFTCLGDIGENPNYGYTSFDHVGWGMLSALQLLTLDNWENLNDQMTHINGFYSKPFLFLIVYFGSFYLLNLTLAVLTIAFKAESTRMSMKEREEMRRIGQQKSCVDDKPSFFLTIDLARHCREKFLRRKTAPGNRGMSKHRARLPEVPVLTKFNMASFKIIAFGKLYFSNGWNIFDFVIILVSILEIAVEDLYSLAVIRSYRLLWLFKLASEWTTMQILLKITFSTFGTLGNLAFVVGVLNYTIADVGLKLLSPYYNNFDFQNSEGERWHFKDFPHSFVLVFRLLCGDWIRPLWQCLRAANYVCYVVFVPAVVVGHLV
ncbi:hypothetical protein BaRGS_00036004, partial [Batillaria attramentaria]